MQLPNARNQERRILLNFLQSSIPEKKNIYRNYMKLLKDIYQYALTVISTSTEKHK